MRNKQLLIRYFDGVIGYVMKSPMFDPAETTCLYLRPGTLSGLCEDFQVVMMGVHDEAITKRIATHVERSGAYFDAVYKVHKLQENRLLVNYKQVFMDFEIPKERIKD